MTPAGEPHAWTVTETLAALRARRIGAVELLDHMLERQARLDGDLNSVIATDTDAARSAAQAADAATEPAGALYGLPMTIKECYDVTGFVTSAGIPDLVENRPEEDADAVARLRAAGAVIWGKTNVPLAASDHQSYNPLFGLTRNPWDKTRSAGGSSGGAAVALAAGFTALEVGSDIGGSIRVPAHFCGVWGHKPTYGVISSRGHVPPAPGALSAAPLSVVGPMARSAEDLTLAMDILAGGSGAWSLKLMAARHDRLDEYRVAVWTGGDGSGYPVDLEYAAAIESFARDLDSEGAQVTLLDAAPKPMERADSLYLRMLFAVIGAGSPSEEVEAYGTVAATRPNDTLAQTVAKAVRASMAEYAALVEAQAQVMKVWQSWFKDFDALLCPVSMTQAFPHQTEDGFGPVPQMARSLKVGDREEPYMKNLLWPGIATFAHLPATARPLPGRLGGLPAGVQMIGPAFGDRTVLRLAELCDQAFGGFVAPEGYA